MATATALDRPNRDGPESLPLAHHRFTVVQYLRMIELEVLTSSDRVELLDGWVVNKMPPNPPHANAVMALTEFLPPMLTRDWVLRIQLPIVLPKSVPEPDAVIARGPRRRYARGHPKPPDIAIVVEVSDASLSEDQGVKFRAYARAGLPEYWIVNLVHRRVEVYRNPRAGRIPGYKQHQDYGPTELLPVALGGRQVGTIAVQELLSDA